jgi:LuxR family maltose regulon positive regulatory protein
MGRRVEVTTGRGRATKGLPAKLTRPSSARSVPRPRLFERLNRERDRRVVWLVGPPGSGKTVLVSTYLDHAPGLGGLWYQVDAGDLEPATFFHYLGLAAEALAPDRRVLFPALTPEYRPGFATFVRRYFEALWPLLGNAPQLVLDNFQDADAEALHVVIGEAAEAAPVDGRLLVLSRGEPPAALARLVAHGDLVTSGALSSGCRRKKPWGWPVAWPGTR